jgi:hypothetical protein
LNTASDFGVVMGVGFGKANPNQGH